MKKAVHINLLFALLDEQLTALILYFKTKTSLLVCAYLPKRIEFYFIDF